MPRSTIAPTSIAELSEVVAAAGIALPHGAQTKPALCAPDLPGPTRIDMTALRGITEYQPTEFVIRALAGTLLTEINEALAKHGQFLPFDPPFAATGATIGGAVASGLNGPSRMRYGGIRDFIIGARFIDGRGTEISTGGKVIKNVAGFDFAKLLVGSFGRLGTIAEVTLKVFPAPASYITVGFDLGHIDAAIHAAEIIAASQLEPYAVEIEPPGKLHVRFGGPSDALSAVVDRAEAMIDAPSARMWGTGEIELWENVRDFAWAKGGELLVKIPVTTRQLSDLDFTFGRIDAQRRYSLAGNVAYATLDSRQLPGITEDLEKLGLCGLVLRGSAPKARFGSLPSPQAEARVKEAMDPSNKYLPLP